MMRFRWSKMTLPNKHKHVYVLNCVWLSKHWLIFRYLLLIYFLPLTYNWFWCIRWCFCAGGEKACEITQNFSIFICMRKPQHQRMKAKLSAIGIKRKFICHTWHHNTQFVCFVQRHYTLEQHMHTKRCTTCT